MPRLPDFNIDTMSFWVGFIAATLFWWLFRYLQKWSAQLKAPLNERIETIRKNVTSGLDSYLRIETLNIAQGMHAASSLCPLDDILIPPRLMLPPIDVDPEKLSILDTIAGQIIPYSPDYPELYAIYHLPTITLSRALQSEFNIAIVGEPGSGKTVALAHLASQLARKDQQVKSLADYLPILIHALDIELILPKDQDALSAIIKIISAQVSSLIRPRLNNYLHSRANKGSLLLLIDGLDEYPPVALKNITNYLGLLLKQYPKIRLVTTCSNHYIDGLATLGFYPFAIAAWEPRQFNAYTHRWAKLWSKNITSSNSAQQQSNINPALLLGWLNNDNEYFTPLEWTLKVWAAFAGDSRDLSPQNVLQSYIDRLNDGKISQPALETIAHDMLLTNQPGLNLAYAEKIASKLKRSAKTAVNTPEAQSAAPLAETAAKKNQRRTKQQSTTTRGQTFSWLVDNGLMSISVREQVRFISPAITGYLASYQVEENAAGLEHPLYWCVRAIALFLSSARNSPAYLYQLMNNEDSPLIPNLFSAARWLKYFPNTQPHNNIMRYLLAIIKDETKPLATRIRALSAFVISNDASRPLLFNQIITSPFPLMRLLAALGSGALNDAKSNDMLIKMLSASETPVRYAAGMALAYISSYSDYKLAVEILEQGEESTRRVIAEYIAGDSSQGYEVLQQAASSEDLLTRRAVVFGLARVMEKWAHTLLEKMAVQDGQWVVRAAATQALENLQNSKSILPRRLPPPAESNWLITFASKLGKGISPGQPATEFLLQALKTGAEDDQLAALAYLRLTPNPPIIKAISEMVEQSTDVDVQNACLYALWFLAIQGTNEATETINQPVNR